MAVAALEDLVMLVALAGRDDVGARAVEAALQVGANEGAVVDCVLGLAVRSSDLLVA